MNTKLGSKGTTQQGNKTYTVIGHFACQHYALPLKPKPDQAAIRLISQDLMPRDWAQLWVAYTDRATNDASPFRPTTGLSGNKNSVSWF